MSRDDAARTEGDKPMLKWLVLSVVVFACLAVSASARAPRDRDHDRMPDRWERRHDLSPTKRNGKRDPDGDHLRNRREFRLRTHPKRADTDRDRLRDGAEVRRFHTNPRRKDTDGDGFRDRCELRKKTNPRKRRSRPKRHCSQRRRLPRTPAPAPPGGSPTGGLPNASNTGVPPGTVLTPSGGMTIGTAGAVINARDISGPVVVNAPNVRIRNSRIRDNGFMLIRSNSTGLVVEDSELFNQGPAGAVKCHNAIGFGNYSLRRSEVHGCENAADAGEGNVVIADNFIHDLDTVGPSHVFGSSGPHTDGIQGNGSNITVRHNWIDPSPGGGVTSGIIATGGSNNYVIEDNYIDGRGASYAIYAPREPGRTGNRINRNRLLEGYGYTACVRLGVTVSEFNGNRDAITGGLIAPDNGAGGGCSN